MIDTLLNIYKTTLTYNKNIENINIENINNNFYIFDILNNFLIQSFNNIKLPLYFFNQFNNYEINIYLFFFFNIILFCYFLICNILKPTQDFTKEYIFYTLISLIFLIYNFIIEIINFSSNFLENFFYYKIFDLEMQIFVIAILYSIFLIFLILNLKKIKNIEYESIFILNILITSIFAILNETNLILIYLLLEIQIFCIFFLISLKKNTIASESTIKYILINIITSGFLLLSIFIFYKITGSFNISIILENFFNFNLLDEKLQSEYFFYFFFSSFLLVFLFKIGIPPLHIWYLNIYNGTFFFFLIFLLIFSKMGYLIFFFNFFQIFKFLSFNENIFQILFFFCTILFCFFIGTFGAIAEKNLKKILIYSSIYQLGFFFFFLLIDLFFYNEIFYIKFSFFETIENIFNINIILYFFNNLLLLISFFLIQNKQNYRINTLSDLRNYEKKKNNIFLFIFLILIFSSIGIPPLIGFFSKYYIFSFLLENEFFLILLFSILASVLSSFYYLRILNNLYFQKTNKNSNFTIHSFYIYFYLYFFVIFMVIFPIYGLNFIENLQVCKLLSFYFI